LPGALAARRRLVGRGLRRLLAAVALVAALLAVVLLAVVLLAVVTLALVATVVLVAALVRVLGLGRGLLRLVSAVVAAVAVAVVAAAVVAAVAAVTTGAAGAALVDAGDDLVHQVLVEDVDEVAVVRDRLVQLLREGVHREQRDRLAAVVQARRVDVVDDALPQLRHGLEAGRAVALLVHERHVRAVVGAVGVAGIPAALEVEGAHHVTALGAQRVLVRQLPVLEARAAPGGVGVGGTVDERLRVTGDDAQEPRHRGDLALRVALEGQRDLLGGDDLTHVA